ncbi:sensor domain-containing diguanylate cyclase [Reinekea blandensis]|uniref:diguanylate cyclase n=1 Tax=Reinekea blandensis MED297 TaxID=314283 RepID=A4BIU7_9GAMM|nr:sensor domain-containing diguanylate cyclase [Reinekea blandensis]EAR07964.1 Response regulator containing a CheY-like receiver domain and a GGDEF domain [Reinekea sp. MED297] [Reinekea blandensis MED297]
MNTDYTGLAEFHWLIEVMQTVDVGVLVLDLEYQITAWNGFMENNSGIDSADALGRSLFDVFDDLSVEWFKHKADTVIQLRNRAFTTWEQRAYVFKFRNNRPITGVTEYMYQNCTFIPVIGTTGKVQNLAVIVYDVTDIATSKLELKAANDRLAQLSRTDGLTQLYNRAYWEEMLSNEFKRQKRHAHDLSLIMFDIDHFKKVNDTYGHQVGDDVIRAVAEEVRHNSRNTDIAGRYGGEEFALLLIDSDAENALLFAERLRKAIENRRVSTPEGELQVTVSLGVAPWKESFHHYNAWIEAADKALYTSKDEGRNRSTLSK